MDSSLGQHIQKLPAATREDAYAKVGRVLLARRKGITPEAEVARASGFGSPEAMHHQLRAWGLTSLLPPEDEGQPSKTTTYMGGGRKGRGGGKGAGEEAVVLPPAVGAKDMFAYAIAQLKSDLHYIEHLEEVVNGPIFEARYVYSKEDAPHPVVYLRGKVSAERWDELCAEQGKDPASTDTLYVSRDSRYLAGTSSWPTMPLVRLIAAYCLCVRTTNDIEALLDRLHPKPEEADRKEVYKYINGAEGVQRRAKKLAQVMRGKPVSQGLNAEGENIFNHTVGDYIRALRGQGVPREEIVRILREEYREEALPDGEIARLFDLFPPR